MDQLAPREGYIPAGNTHLYYREIGQGQPLLIVHGGPDFDHNYLLPDMDRLSDAFRLIYYAQRGRGKSSGNVHPEDVTVESEMEDLDAVRNHFQLESVAILGHSWGGLLAMEYAIRHPDRVSHMILLNTAPASRDDYLRFRQARLESTPADIEKLRAMLSSGKYKEGDLEDDAAYYRIHFRATVRQPEDLERVVKSLRVNFTQESMLRAKEIEERLMNETWSSSEYDLLPRLKRLSILTLVIHAENDFVPLECAAHIAQTMPGARFVSLKDCGHFSFIECPDDVRKELVDFFHST